MKVKKNGDGYSYSYSNSLDVEIQKAEKEIQKIEEIIPFYRFSYTQAEKQYQSKYTRLNHLKAFVRLAKEKQESETE